MKTNAQPFHFSLKPRSLWLLALGCVMLLALSGILVLAQSQGPGTAIQRSQRGQRRCSRRLPGSGRRFEGHSWLFRSGNGEDGQRKNCDLRLV